jgi:hypothetical protein
LEYLIMDSTLKLIEVDFEHFSLELIQSNSDMESIKENSIT